MYKVYYEMGDQNQPFAKDYNSLKWALRFAHKISKDPDIGWLDITNCGETQSWYHMDYKNFPDFHWHNSQSFSWEELPKWMTTP